eukprot:1305962-Rhodomonas_salina.1
MDESAEKESTPFVGFGVFGVKLERENGRPGRSKSPQTKTSSFKLSGDEAEAESPRSVTRNTKELRSRSSSPAPKKQSLAGRFFSIPSTLQHTLSSGSFSPMVSVSAEESVVSDCLVSRQASAEGPAGEQAGVESSFPNISQALKKESVSVSAWDGANADRGSEDAATQGMGRTSSATSSTSAIPGRVSSSAALQRQRSHGRNRDLYKPATTQKVERKPVKRGVKVSRKHPELKPEYYMDGAKGYGSLVHAAGGGMHGSSTFTYGDPSQ